MCGILGIFDKKVLNSKYIQTLSRRMRHRGPDMQDMQDFQINQTRKGMITHKRLAIIDLHTGKQPIQRTFETYVAHNGEIYNFQSLKENELKDSTFRTACDSEVIVKLYDKYGVDFCNRLDGVFGVIIMDGENFMVARDPIGIKPFFMGLIELENMHSKVDVDEAQIVGWF